MIKVHIHCINEVTDPKIAVSLPEMPKEGDLFESAEESGKFYTVQRVWIRLEKRQRCSVHMELPSEAQP
jgi:hypothetical protein